jgi:hypothetical protein
MLTCVGTFHLLRNQYQGNKHPYELLLKERQISVVTPRYGSKGTAGTSVSLAVCSEAHKGFPLRIKKWRNIHERRPSQLDASDRLARTLPAVKFAWHFL